MVKMSKVRIKKEEKKKRLLGVTDFRTYQRTLPVGCIVGWRDG